MKLLKSLVEYNRTETEENVLANLKSAEKASEERQNCKGFALEQDNGSIVKVFVKAEQADDFERVLSSSLQLAEDEGKEIPEVLYELRDKFDIVDVEWGEHAIPEDEELEEPAAAPEEGGEGEAIDFDAEMGGEEGAEEGEDLEMDATDMEGMDDMGGEEDVAATLQSVIDMMKADAEAKTAQAQADKAKYETELAKNTLQAAEYRAAQEEELLDMEEFNKRQDDEKKAEENRKKLIKYRHDKNKLGESMKYPQATPEEEEFLDMEDWEKAERDKSKSEKDSERMKKYRHAKRKGTEDEETAAKPKEETSTTEKKPTGTGMAGREMTKARRARSAMRRARSSSRYVFAGYDMTKHLSLSQFINLTEGFEDTLVNTVIEQLKASGIDVEKLEYDELVTKLEEEKLRRANQAQK